MFFKSRIDFFKSPMDFFESGISGLIYRGDIHGPVYGPVHNRLPRNAVSTLCSVCLDFEQNYARPENFSKIDGDHFIMYVHHGSLQALKDSMQNGCQLCKLLYNGYVYTCYALRKEEDEGKSLQEIASLIDHLEPSRPQLHIVFKPSDQPPFDSHRELPRGRMFTAAADFSLAKEWVTNCQNNHPSCQAVPTGNPTRLLQIIDDTTSIKLVVTDPSQTYKYVTLSHRWGDFKPALTHRSNLQEHMHGIPVRNLPATFRDAVLATNKLGYQYLWIDSLCIVQDDNKDWEIECPRMSSVFQGATLTIAVPGAKDSSVGFLHKRPLHDDPAYQYCALRYRDSQGRPITTIKIWYPGFHRSKDAPVDMDDRLARVRDVCFPHGQSQILGKEPESVLTNRGWVVQERMLSSRILYFGTYQMYFECSILTRDECTHDDSKDFSRLTSIQPFSTWKRSWWWSDFIREYSQRTLTFNNDRLPAISGIIHACKPPPGEVYLAGIWKSNLPEGLLWYVLNRKENTKDPIVAHMVNETGDNPSAIVARQYYVAPSWSWASVNCKVGFEDYEFKRFGGVSALEFISCSTTLVDSSADGDPYGRVKAGYLKVCGKLCKAAVTQTTNPKIMYAWKVSSQGTFQYPVEAFPDNESEFVSQITTDISGPPETIDPRGAFPELYALAVGVTGGWHGFGLLLAPIFEKENHFRRVGILKFNSGKRARHQKDMAIWFGDSLAEGMTTQFAQIMTGLMNALSGGFGAAMLTAWTAVRLYLFAAQSVLIVF
ncbi:het-domain-containing protein [Fusarium coicis]|nr:het-domain-containing protein [Fusarium coicis]